MIKESAFRQKEVYANRVLIYAQNEKIYELSSDMNELGEIAINHSELENPIRDNPCH
jgi:hypothetical protein